ncbi:hypothetical protein SmJEL517_g04741 [Synchytrium microbalum]|uniref:LIM zinc-binding domain-containing protein n=1 Tax=Synchytrium microbalum TaxID=1806994 RepID=A0A507BYW3_9FUNG|nr:uncharacterized protein SmJEL517_g04741 [Synchytrium microbalum]TPX32049.1 hypothetical protein SmJEL517_g04741 [Synchytrium microbalum]
MPREQSRYRQNTEYAAPLHPSTPRRENNSLQRLNNLVFDHYTPRSRVPGPPNSNQQPPAHESLRSRVRHREGARNHRRTSLYFDSHADIGPSALHSCDACQQPISGPTIVALNRNWHPAHFNCFKCKNTLNSGKFFEHEQKPFCERCFHESFSPTCSYCGEIITKVGASLKTKEVFGLRPPIKRRLSLF